MIPDWALQLTWFCAGIGGTGAIWYFLSQKHYHSVLWTAFVTVVIVLLAVALHIRNDLIRKEAAAGSKSPTATPVSLTPSDPSRLRPSPPPVTLPSPSHTQAVRAKHTPVHLPIGAADTPTASHTPGEPAATPSKPAAVMERYFLRNPYYDMDTARAAARDAGKLIFVVIYDRDHSQLSRLRFSLGYFMEYETTKKLVEQYFVPVLVDSSGEARSLVPLDDPLENCRWVVLTTDGDIIRSEGVYANPDEGLRRVREVIAVTRR